MNDIIIQNPGTPTPVSSYINCPAAERLRVMVDKPGPCLSEEELAAACACWDTLPFQNSREDVQKFIDSLPQGPAQKLGLAVAFLCERRAMVQAAKELCGQISMLTAADPLPAGKLHNLFNELSCLGAGASVGGIHLSEDCYFNNQLEEYVYWSPAFIVEPVAAKIGDTFGAIQNWACLMTTSADVEEIRDTLSKIQDLVNCLDGVVSRYGEIICWGLLSKYQYEGRPPYFGPASERSADALKSDPVYIINCYISRAAGKDKVKELRD